MRSNIKSAMPDKLVPHSTLAEYEIDFFSSFLWTQYGP